MKKIEKRAITKAIVGCVFVVILFGCANVRSAHPEEDSKNSVGDIEFDALLDDSTFKRCHSQEYTAQYFNLALYGT
jgi:hypothetical protein